MNFLLDTNVVSEPMKVSPNPGVLAWLADADEDRVFVSVVTITEFRYGVERLAPGKRRDVLDKWLQRDLIPRFAGKILPVDVEIADLCGKLLALSESKGRPLEARDGFIAATAEAHGMALVTRNASDFEPKVRTIVTPWS